MEDYRKYKWFFTKSGKLVIGGKSATQNDELLHLLKHSNNDFIVMHTQDPGSPFCAIISDSKKVSEGDIKECAVFTACFSKAWKSGKKKALVDIFKVSEIFKKMDMKTGTWGVSGKIRRLNCDLILCLVVQKNIIRAVPESSVKSSSSILLKIVPGTIDKKDMLTKLQIELDQQFSNEDLLSALPAGGIKILRE